jgi:hypothetical protein
MIRTTALLMFGLALASAAQAMPVSPMHKPDNAVTQARMACGVGRGTILVPASPKLAYARSGEQCVGAKTGGRRDVHPLTERGERPECQRKPTWSEMHAC